jgi:uncharacterized protein (TIGR02246 family)
LDRVLADEFTIGEFDGTVTTKTQLLSYINSGEYALTSVVSDDMKVRVYGNAAVVAGLSTEKSQFKGIDSSGQYRWTDTWIQRDGRWQCVAGHASKVTTQATDTASVEQEIMKLERVWADSTVKRDVDALARLMADDITFGHSEGNWWTKDQVLSELRTGEIATTSAVNEEMKVRVYGDMAIITGRWIEKGKLRGVDSSGQYIWTDTWQKRDGRWQCIASHGSKVTASSANEDIDKLRATLKEFVQAYGNKDLEKCVGTYTEDAMYLIPGMEILRGRPAIREFLADPASGRAKFQQEIVELKIEGNLAYVVVNQVVSVQMQDQTTRSFPNKFMHLWKKQQDGSWKILIDMVSDRPGKK